MPPGYFRKERLVDGAIHGLGVAGSVVARGFLLHRVLPARELLATAAAAAYGGGLIAMVWLSATYKPVLRPDWKERTRLRTPLGGYPPALQSTGSLPAYSSPITLPSTS